MCVCALVTADFWIHKSCWKTSSYWDY